MDNKGLFAINRRAMLGDDGALFRRSRIEYVYVILLLLRQSDQQKFKTYQWWGGADLESVMRPIHIAH